MKNTLAVLVILAMTASLAGQSHHNRASRMRAVPAAAVSQTDLNATLTNLEHAAAATHSDISDMRIDKWGGGWKPGFLKSSHVKDAEQTAVSIKRNLVGALPSLIGEVRNTHGSMTATFKLYDDLSVVCEALGSLVSTTQTYGKKEEYEPLARDFSAMSQVRRHLSSYIETKAGAMEGRSSSTYASSAAPKRSSRAKQRKNVRTVSDDEDSISQRSSGPLPKKIIVDDNVPAQKKASLQYNNQ
jgi:hypothetical protein